MSNSKVYPYNSLTDDKLIDFTLEEIDKLRLLLCSEDSEQLKRGILKVNELIIEVKRRHLYLKKPLLMKRIFSND